MSGTESQFLPVDGEHHVTIEAGSDQFEQFIGKDGLLVATHPDGLVRISFSGEIIDVSAAFVVAFDPAQPSPGPNIGIYFGTETGNTEYIAEKIRVRLNDCNIAAFKDISKCSVAELLAHDVLLLGISTWNIGDIQYDWEEKLGELASQNYEGTKVGMFGLGDAAGYPDTFVDGLGILWEEIKEKGPELIGIWPITGYEFDASKGMHDDAHFLGVVIDEDGEPEKTDERLDRWVAQLRSELNLPEATEAA